IVPLAPGDLERTAGQLDRHLAAGQPLAGGGNRGGAGGGATRPGQAGATLPGADLDAVGADHLRKADIGALGEDRVVLEQGPEAGESVIVGVVLDPEDRVR